MNAEVMQETDGFSYCGHCKEVILITVAVCHSSPLLVLKMMNYTLTEYTHTNAGKYAKNKALAKLYLQKSRDFH